SDDIGKEFQCLHAFREPISFHFWGGRASKWRTQSQGGFVSQAYHGHRQNGIPTLNKIFADRKNAVPKLFYHSKLNRQSLNNRFATHPKSRFNPRSKKWLQKNLHDDQWLHGRRQPINAGKQSLKPLKSGSIYGRRFPILVFA